MSKLLRYLKEYKKYVIIAPLFLFLEVIMEVLMPTVMGKMVSANGDGRTTIMLGLLMIAMAIFALVCGIIGARISALAGTGLSHNLREGMFSKIQDFAFADVDNFGTASLLTRATGDVSNTQDAFISTIRILSRSPLMLISSSVMIFLINPKIALIFLFIVPIIVAAFVIIFRLVAPRFQVMMEKTDELNNTTQENLSGIRVVKSFVREKFEGSKFKEKAGGLRDAHAKAIGVLLFASPIITLVFNLAIAAVVWVGGNLVVSGEIVTGEFISLFDYSRQILMSMIIFASVFIQISISKASADRISEVLSHPISIKNGENPIMTVSDGSIEFSGVSFKYSGAEEYNALNDVSLSIKAGEMIGIIGGTGSSKSTLVQMIPRLYDVGSGVVKVGGVDVKDYDIKTLRESVAMVLQKNVLFSGTIKENLLWGNKDATDEEIVRACKIAQAHDFVSAFPDGYNNRVEQGGVNLSGGQKQRLCIARALLKEPKVIILDDSTNAVDTATDASIRKALREELIGTTSIIVAQRIASVESADRIIVMENGQIDAVGTHEELLAGNGIYTEIYDLQTRGGGINGEQ